MNRATNRQIKVLKFFGEDFQRMSRASARSKILEIFSVPQQKELWDRYVYLTGDTEHKTQLLKHFDAESLEKISLPKNWDYLYIEDERYVERGFEKKQTDTTILSSGPLFDIPAPHINHKNREFCFSGEFDNGRINCEETVKELGGKVAERVRVSTDYLIVGNKDSPKWKNKKFGKKIERATELKLSSCKIAIIRESDWWHQISATH